MKVFRKISLVAVMFAISVLVAHAIVPHHHSENGDIICSNDNFHNHSESHHDCCNDHKEHIEQDFNHHCGGVLCGMSHTYIHSPAAGFNLVLFSIDCPSIIPEPDFIHSETNHTAHYIPLSQEYIARGVPLRAPPVVI